MIIGGKEGEAMVFDSEALLAMDYQDLRKYTEEAIIERPSLFGMMRNINIKENEGTVHNTRVYLANLAKKRCISAYIGVCDPLKK